MFRLFIAKTLTCWHFYLTITITTIMTLRLTWRYHPFAWCSRLYLQLAILSWSLHSSQSWENILCEIHFSLLKTFHLWNQNIKKFSRFCEVDFLRGPIAAGSNGRSSVQPRWAKLSAINSTNIQMMMTMMVRRWRMAKVLLSNKTCKNSKCSLFLLEQYQHKQ